MKINIPTEKIKDLVRTKSKIIIFSLIAFLIVVLIVGGYFALNPITNEEARAEGESNLQELEITFDKNILNQLPANLAPTTVEGQGGRNPFMPY